MMLRTLIASLAVSVTSLAIAGGCGAETTSVAETERKSSCTQPCDGDKAAAVTLVSNDASDCNTPCTGAKTQQVADKSDCSQPCTGDKAAMQTVANEGASCSQPCTGEKTSGVSLVSYMPKMGYEVNGECIPCPKSAAAMAKKSNDHVQYVVNEVSYDSKAEAMAAHAKQLETFMMDLVRIQYAVDGECVPCPDKAQEMASSCSSKQMQYKVGPAVFDNAEDAIRASIMAYNAAQKVHMEYAAGDTVTQCSTSAKDMAKKAGCSVEYVVNGQRTPCSKTAGYLKTVASVESALKALETVQGAGA